MSWILQGHTGHGILAVNTEVAKRVIPGHPRTSQDIPGHPRTSQDVLSKAVNTEGCPSTVVLVLPWLLYSGTPQGTRDSIGDAQH